MRHTIGYKQGWIHISYYDRKSPEVVRVQVDGYAYSIEVKSVHAAKMLITKHAKRYGGAK